jgi:hypothetical protein
MIGCGELDGHQASLRGLLCEPATCGTTRVLEKSGDFKASKAPDDVDEAARSPTPNGLDPINDRVGMPQEEFKTSWQSLSTIGPLLVREDGEDSMKDQSR